MISKLSAFAILVVAAPALSACGGSHADPKESIADTASAQAPTSAPTSVPSSQPEASSDAVPETCAQKGSVCAPPVKFVKRLCSTGNADVALYMFKKGSPFTRGYLAKNVQGWNASGGAASNDQLVFDEEVIVLLERKPDAGAIQVSGSGGGYDVLRWDGTCASLQTEELTFQLPPKAKNAKVDFHGLANATQDVLTQDEKLAKLNGDRRKECKGVTMGDVSAKCVKLVDQLSAAVVDYVRAGGNVPTPAKLP